jgi:hypothetical protein
MEKTKNAPEVAKLTFKEIAGIFGAVLFIPAFITLMVLGCLYPAFSEALMDVSCILLGLVNMFGNGGGNMSGCMLHASRRK